MEKLMEYYYRILKILIYYSLFKNISFYFTNEAIPTNITVMNSLGMYKKDIKYPFESINGFYTNGYSLNNNTANKEIYFNGNNSFNLSDGIILKEKFICSSRLTGLTDFIKESIWCDEKIKTYGSNALTKPTTISKNNLYYRDFTFTEFDENGYPLTTNMTISNSYLTYDASETFDSKEVYSLVNVNDLGKDYIFDNTDSNSAYSLKQYLYINSTLPIYVLNSFSKPQSSSIVEDNITKENFLNEIYMNLVYEDNIGISKVGPQLLAQIALKQRISEYYIADLSNDLCIYYISYNDNILRIEKIQNDEKLVTIIGKTYAGLVDISIRDNLTNSVSITPPNDMTLGIKISKTTEGIKIINLVSENENYKFINTYINNETLGKFKSSGRSADKTLIPVYSDVEASNYSKNNNKITALFFNEDKYIGYVYLHAFNGIEDMSASSFPTDAANYKATIKCPSKTAFDITEDVDIYLDVFDEGSIINRDVLVNSKRFFEDYLLNDESYTTYLDDHNHKSLSYKIDNSRNIYSLDINNNIKENYIDHFIGTSNPSEIYYIGCVYGKIYTNFNLSTQTGDPNFKNFFKITGYTHIPYANFHTEKYVLLTGDDDNPNAVTSRQISILKNNGISELDLDAYIASFNDNSLVNYYFLKNTEGYTDPPEEPDGINHFKLNDDPKVISTYESSIYEETGNVYTKKELDNPPNEIYCIEVNFDTMHGINAVPYLTNEENEIENHFDYLNLLDNKVPFYRLKYTPIIETNINTEENENTNDESSIEKELPKYKYYAFSVNNEINICRSVSNIDGSNPFIELLGVLKFSDDFILCGNEEYIVAIRNQWSINDDEDTMKKYAYKTSYLALKYEDIINHIYNNLDKYIFNSPPTMNIFSDIEFKEDILLLKDNIIEETSIIDDNKSDYYDLENQTVITSNLMEINYAKLYNTNEDDITLSGQPNNEYRLFICMNGRVLVSNNIFDFTHTTEIVEETDEEDNVITKEVVKPNIIPLADFYTINGRVNNIYIETVDIDNNDLMCIASDRNELYIFKNLFKYNSNYYKRPYEEYFSDKLTRRCLKYIYNFNNLPLEIDEEIEDDPRREYYRETLTPTILNIGSSVDDITVCDKYLNTLNKEITKININDENKEELIFTNNIKYFKLSEDLLLNSENINVEGDNNDENNYFDDNNNYIKIESFRTNDEFIEELTDRAVMLNFHLNINNRIVRNNEYYTFNYYLESTDPQVTIPDNMTYHDYNLTNNSVIYETNNIFKNIYVYLPKDTLNNSSIIGINDLSKSEKYYLLEYENTLKNDSFGMAIIDSNNYAEDNSNYIYNLPVKLHYEIIYSLFENEKTPSEITNLPKKLTTRDHFIASVNDGNNEVNRLYFRWRYLGGKPVNNDPEESDIEFDYYLLSFTRSNIYSYESNSKDMMKYITLLLRNYAMRTFDSTNNTGDFSINKIEFDGEYHWTSLNLPRDTTKPKLFNIIVAKKKGDPPSHTAVGHDPYKNNFWFDEIAFDDNFVYMTRLNTETIRKVNIPYEKVAISFEDYINFLEYMEGAIIRKTNSAIDAQFNIEWAYQPSISWNKSINFVITTNTVDLNDINNSEVQAKILKNIHNNFIFISNHDYYYQNNIGYENSLMEDGIITSEINPYYNEEYDSNIYYDFIKWKYNYDSYDQYEDFLWSLILDEEDIHNYKVNSNDGSFEMKDTKLRDNWWYKIPNDTNLTWWEDPNYRNSWINENYMPIKNTLYTDEVKIYTDEVYNTGFNYNINYDTFGLIYLSEDISKILHYGIEKRLITGIYIDGLKLFNEGYYFKDLLNNCQDIFINPNNLKSYFADTKKFPYFSQLLYMMNEALKPTYEYNEQLKQYELWETDPHEYMKHHEFAPTKPNKDDVPKPEINLRNILSNIEVNTNFGLVSEQEKLVATIDVINTKDETAESDITRLVKSLNDEGAYFINQYYDESNDDDLVLNQNKINDSGYNVFTNSLKLVFTDQYIKNIVNNNDRINIYISYKNDIGGKYARRINPKFINISIEGQNVNLEIKGFYQYETISTIYIVSGDINNHNMFFKNIDSSIEYIDLMELGEMGNGRLFKWLSYDTILSAEDVEINMNGYILYPNIDYTVVNANYTQSAKNLIMFRNIVPSNGDISVELNLRPDSNAKLVYKTNQAYSLCYEKYKEIPSDKDLKKVPISKTVTMDNDRYQFLVSTVNGETTNKFDIYINNMKVPNKFIRVVNSKTIDLLVDDKDYAIDLHKTHIAKFNEGQYELTTEYNKNESNDYRYFDPIFENILIVFQNKFNPYNYEIEIANKYSEENFVSLLDNLFFRLERDDTTLSPKETNSCYVPSNSVNVYDNFDWICENNGGTINNINSNVKVDLLNNAENIINCNIDNLNFNISFDSEPLDNDILKDNILFDCNPLIGDTDKLQPLIGEFRFESFDWRYNYLNNIIEKSVFQMDAIYSHEEHCSARKIVLYRAEKLVSDESEPVFRKTDVVYYIPEDEYVLSRYNKQCEEPFFEYPTNPDEYMNKDLEIYFKLIAFDEDNMNIAESEPLKFNSNFGSVTITGEYAPDISHYVYDEEKVAVLGTINIEPNAIVNKVVLLKANPVTDEFNIVKDTQTIPDNWRRDGKTNGKLPIDESQEFIIFDLNPADFDEKGIRCKFAALTKSGYTIAESEVFTFKFKYSDKFIIADKDPDTKTCSLILYIGDPNALMPDGIIDPDHPENGNVIPIKVKDPIDTTDGTLYTPTVLESTCFNYSDITNIDLGKTITEIR
ncbi:MAG TPA: hypothetical protein PK507_03475 [bacterium]|nr:hypothetical protein [bacterium]